MTARQTLRDQGRRPAARDRRNSPGMLWRNVAAATHQRIRHLSAWRLLQNPTHWRGSDKTGGGNAQTIPACAHQDSKTASRRYIDGINVELEAVIGITESGAAGRWRKLFITLCL